MKLSVTPFCQGLPGSINAVLIPCATTKDKIAFDTNSGPLSLRRKAGAPRSRALTTGTGAADEHLLDWCTRPGVADARDRQRAERVIASLERRR